MHIYFYIDLDFDNIMYKIGILRVSKRPFQCNGIRGFWKGIYSESLLPLGSAIPSSSPSLSSLVFFKTTDTPIMGRILVPSIVGCILSAHSLLMTRNKAEKTLDLLKELRNKKEKHAKRRGMELQRLHSFYSFPEDTLSQIACPI